MPAKAFYDVFPEHAPKLNPHDEPSNMFNEDGVYKYKVTLPSGTEYSLRQCKGTVLLAWSVNRGKLPEVLKGKFTNERQAMLALRRYIATNTRLKNAVDFQYAREQRAKEDTNRTAEEQEVEEKKAKEPTEIKIPDVPSSTVFDTKANEEEIEDFVQTDLHVVAKEAEAKNEQLKQIKEFKENAEEVTEDTPTKED